MTSSSSGKAERRQVSHAAGDSASTPPSHYGSDYSNTYAPNTYAPNTFGHEGASESGATAQAMRERLKAKPKRGRRKPLQDKAKTPDARLAETIEAEIIPRLWLAHRTDAAVRTATFDCASLAGDRAGSGGPPSLQDAIAFSPAAPLDSGAFAHLAVRDSSAALLSYVEELMTAGMPLETVFLGVLAPAARRLGEYWSEDVYSFTDVTVGLCRLRQVFEELRVRLPEVAPGPERFSALVMTSPGDDHNFGAAMIGHLFEQAGWHVLQPGPCAPGAVLALLRLRSVDLLGISLTTDQGLEALPGFVLKVRRESKNRNLTIMLGGGLIAARPEIAREVGAIAAADDPKRAIEQAEEIVRRVARRI